MGGRGQFFNKKFIYAKKNDFDFEFTPFMSNASIENNNIEDKLFDDNFAFNSNQEAGEAANEFISNNTFSLNDRQDLHLKGKKGLIPGKSLIESKDGKNNTQIKEMLNEIVNKYKGTGKKRIINGKWDHKEKINLSPEDVKKYNFLYESLYKSKYRTGDINRFTIHYRKNKSVHLVADF